MKFSITVEHNGHVWNVRSVGFTQDGVQEVCGCHQSLPVAVGDLANELQVRILELGEQAVKDALKGPTNG